MSDAYETRLLIGGEQTAGTGPLLEVENPYDESVIARFGAAALEQIDAAVGAARDATRVRGDAAAAERGEMLHEVAARTGARTDELSRLMTLEDGKPLIENSDEVGWV